jgi:hypothetical protein
MLKLFPSEHRAFFILWPACALSILAVIPYSLAAFHFPQTPPTAKIVSKALLNGLLIFPLMIYLGFLLKRRAQVAGLPILEGREKPTAGFWRFSVLSGLLAFALIAAPGILLSKTPHATHENGLFIFYGFLASFYGGITEELMMRFFVMSLLALLLRKLAAPGMWASIVLSAILFGVGHVPAATNAMGVSSWSQIPLPILAQIIAFNSIVGLITGWLYWKKGLEAAVVSHFTTDLGLHVIAPLF